MADIIPETYWAWLAGMFDGEGNITLSMSFKRTHSPRLNIHIQCMVALHQSRRSLSMLEEVRDTLGYGCLRFRESAVLRDDQCRGGMALFQTTSRADSLHLLGHIIPYMRVKRAQAELMVHVLGMLETAYARRAKFGRGERRLTKQEALDLAAMAATMNEREDGQRICGKSFEYMKKRIDEVYNQPLIPNRPRRPSQPSVAGYDGAGIGSAT